MGIAPLTAYFDEEALTALLQLAITADAASGDKRLDFKVQSGGTDVEIAVYPLRATFGAPPPGGATPENVRITVRAFIFNIPLYLWLFARITSDVGAIVLTNLNLRVLSRDEIAQQIEAHRAALGGPGGEQGSGSPSLVDLVNLVIGLLKPLLDKVVIKVPFRVEDIYHSDLDAKLYAAGVVQIEGVYLLCAVLNMRKSRGAGASLTAMRLPLSGLSAPPKTRTPELSPGEGRGQDQTKERIRGKIDALVSVPAFNLIADAIVVGKPEEVRRKDNVLIWKTGVQTEVEIDTLAITIPSSTGEADAKLSFGKTRAGLGLAGLWAGLNVGIKSARATVDIGLSADEGTPDGYLDFEKITKLEVRLRKLGAHPLPVATWLFDEVVDDVVRPVLNKWFKGLSFPVLTLPTKLPGIDVPIALAYRHRGAQFVRGAAVFELSIDPPPPPTPAGEQSSWEIRRRMQFGASSVLLEPYEARGQTIQAELTIEAPGNGTYFVLVSDLLNNNKRVFVSDAETGALPGRRYTFTYQASSLTLLLLQLNWSLNGDEELRFSVKLTRAPGGLARAP